MSVQKIFEAHLHTVSLDNDPFMNKFKATVLEGKASVNTMLAESKTAGIVTETHLNKLKARATNVDAQKTKFIMESNVPSKLKAAMLTSVICGVNLFEAGEKRKKPFKVKTGTTVDYEGDTYKWMGHGWGKFNPEATSKKKQWLPFSGKELKDTLTTKATEEGIAKAKEDKRKANQAEIKRQSADASYAEFARTGDDWDEKQKAEADKYRERTSAEDAEWEAEQQATADKYKDLQRVPATIEPEADIDFDEEIPEPEQERETRDFIPAERKPQREVPEDEVEDAEYAASSEKSSPDKSEPAPEQHATVSPVDKLQQEIRGLNSRAQTEVLRLIDRNEKWADLAASIIIAGKTQEILTSIDNK